MFTPVTASAASRARIGQLLSWLGAFVLLAMVIGGAIVLGFSL
jgi:hypothetical protein